MTPYFEQDGVTLYHGDCREILPQLGQFDLLLTDPPYGINENTTKQQSRQGHGLASQKNYGTYDWDQSTCPDALGAAVAASVCQIIFGGNYYVLPPSSCWLVWDKDNGTTDFADCELAWTNMKRAVRKFKYKWQGMLQEHAGTKKEIRQHPTQKPLPLMRWCLTLVPDAKTILDPFAGSGTTLLAARLEGRQAVGIEISERYCEIAANRLRQKLLF